MQQTNPLNQQHIRWIEEHLWFFEGKNRTLTKEEGRELFAIWTWYSGKNQRLTNCGRCVVSAKEAVWRAYNKQKQNDDQ